MTHAQPHALFALPAESGPLAAEKMKEVRSGAIWYLKFSGAELKDIFC
jgi:hypothetical protein